MGRPNVDNYWDDFGKGKIINFEAYSNDQDEYIDDLESRMAQIAEITKPGTINCGIIWNTLNPTQKKKIFSLAKIED